MNQSEIFEKIREKFVELGDNSTEKSYFPHMQDKLTRLQMFRELIDHAGVGIFMVKLPSFEISDLNQAASNLVYYESKKLIKSSFKDLIEKHFLDLLQHLYENFSTKTTTKRAVLKTRLGFNVAVEMNIQLATYDDIFYHIIMVRDLASIAKLDSMPATDETTFKHIFNNTHDAIMVYDTRGNIIEVNDTMLDMYGLPRELAHDYTLVDYSGNPTQIKNIPEIIRMVQNGKDLVFEWLARKPLTGRTFDAEVSLRKIKWMGNDSIIAVVRDVTERKLHEHQLKANEERYRKILDTITDYIFTVEIVNSRPVRTIHNPACMAVTGYTHQELETNPFLWVQMIHPDDVNIVNHKISRIMSGVNTGPFEHRIIRKDGIERWILNTPVIHIDEWGSLTSYDGIIKDITERKMMELHFIQNEEKFKALYQKMNDAVVIIDAGNIIDCNNNATVLFGIDKKDFISRPFLHFVPGELSGDTQSHQGILLEKMSQASLGVPQFFEYSFKKANGEHFSADVNLCIIEHSVLQLIIRDITEKKQTDEKIKAINTFNSLVLNSIDALVLVLDKNLRIVSFNKACETFSGLTLSDVTGQYFWDVATLPDERDLVKSGLLQKVAQGNSFSTEHFWLTTRNEKRWITWNNALLFDTHGSMTHLICSGIDVSERRWFMESLGTASTNSMLKTGTDFFNDTCKQLVEVLHADFIMIGMYENDYREIKSLAHSNNSFFTSSPLMATFDSPYGTMATQKTLISEEFISVHYPSNTFITQNNFESFTGIPLFSPDNTLVGLIAIFFKKPFNNKHVVESVARIFSIRISAEIERLQYEENLLMSSQLLELSNKLSNTGYCFMNQYGTLQWSKQMFSIFDITGHNPTGFDDIETLVVGEHRETFRQFISSDSSLMSIDFTIAPPGKPEKHLFATMETICENRKKINTRLWIFRDITTRRNAEKDKEKLLAALEKKNKELESILYIASHDLRSPLVNAQGFGSLLEIIKGELRSKLEETAMNEDDRSVMLTILDERISMPIRFINSSCLKMDSLIQGLLSLSRTGIIPMEVSKLDMNIMLEGIVQTLTIQIHRADATLEVESLPSCTGDEMQINQLFTNLIDNAIKYRDTNRKLTINVSGTTEGTMSVYKVSDTGKGIPDYQLEKIWKLFHRCDPQGEVTGEGLGLTIAKRIAERQGGSITAESQPDRGTTFIISIPTNIAAQ